jgi:hypothetical protein
LPGGAYGAYNWYLYGAPWKTGYTSLAESFKATVFASHLAGHAAEMLLRFTPLLLLPMLWAVWVRKPRALLFVTWFSVIWFFYSFWAFGPDEWWYSRFLLPGFPPLFLLAADGWQALLSFLAARRPAWSAWGHVAMMAVAGALIVHHIGFVRSQGYMSFEFGKPFHDVAVSAREKLPPNAVIGALDTSGSLRLYGGFDVFFVRNSQAQALVRDLLKARRRRVYLVSEDGPLDDRWVGRLLDRYRAGPAIPLEGWGHTYAMELYGVRRLWVAGRRQR